MTDFDCYPAPKSARNILRLMRTPSSRPFLVRPTLLRWNRVHDSAKAFHRQQFVGQARLHRWRNAKCFVLAAEIVVEEVERQSCAMVVDLQPQNERKTGSLRTSALLSMPFTTVSQTCSKVCPKQPPLIVRLQLRRTFEDFLGTWPLHPPGPVVAIPYK
jgi:hypothetical protein